MEIKGKTYPGEFYVIRHNGKVLFFDEDPRKYSDKEAGAINLGEYLLEGFGEADAINPLVIKVAGVVLQRGQAFDITMPGKVARGLLPKHFEDATGMVVEILATKSGDPAYPINGVVVGEDGNVIGTRKYSGTGACSDGDVNHRLIVMNGVLKSRIQEEETEKL